ncbi:2-hydroxyacid dehydrogenase [Roseibium sediminis]|uniref:2-hydroxyacid dehydrogenase n=1 Tax=Roseibium sediminis TaxID=1775174 RepID=UPI00123DE281|nr:2-hydroxyacid dehydrogenase [Roseibium sediminis]
MPKTPFRVDVFSTKPYDTRYLQQTVLQKNVGDQFDLRFHESRLNAQTVALASGADAVCVFVNDDVCAETIEVLAAGSCKLIALRCAGFNNVDLKAADANGITVCRVPAYSPHAVAEHTVALMLTLNRKTHKAYNRVREGNFALDGLMGFDMHGKTAGIVGTGLIGEGLARILLGFGCKVLAFDPTPNDACVAMGVDYVGLNDLFAASDILSLQCPLTPQTHHLIDDKVVSQMKRGVMLINTSRGAVVDTQAVLRGLKSGHIGSLGLDVYEEESSLFFEDLSSSYIPDDLFARLLTFPNVIITSHQGFFTEEALSTIAETTIGNIQSYRESGVPTFPVTSSG